MNPYDQFVLGSSAIDKQAESRCCLSDTCSGSTGGNSIKRVAHSDEELILASSKPKRKAGRRVFNETRHPIYRGIRRKNNNKWVCEIRQPKKKTRIWLGTYPTPEMAARAHDVAALAFKGKSACLNFSDSGVLLPKPISNDANDIKKVAAEAAEAFRPREFGGVFENGIEDKVLVDEESKEIEDKSSCVHYVDHEFEIQEEVFDMAGWLNSMAQGPLLSPPHYLRSDMNWDYVETQIEADCSLWNFSF